jgi:hypothetical protein
LNESGKSEKEDVPSISEEDEPTPRPRHPRPGTQVFDGSLSEPASTDDPGWEPSHGGIGSGEIDEHDGQNSGTMETEDSGADSILASGSPLEKLEKNKARSKSSKRKGLDNLKGKGKVGLRSAISEGRRWKQPVVRR